MALMTSFTANQYIGNPIGCVITDTSTGSDNRVTNRYIYITNAAGQYLVPAGNPNPTYIDWPVSAGNTISIPILFTDLALNIELDWVAVVNNAILAENGNLLISETINYLVLE